MNEQLPEYVLIRSNIKNVYIQIKNDKVIVKAPKLLHKSVINDIVKKKENWIKKRLEKIENKNKKQANHSNEEFINIVENNLKELVSLTNLKPNKVRIKDIHYAWGSCSSKKNITINANLINYSSKAIRYVILHELCHLRYMNHSKEFWNLVSTYMPEYKEVRKEFK